MTQPLATDSVDCADGRSVSGRAVATRRYFKGVDKLLIEVSEQEREMIEDALREAVGLVRRFESDGLGPLDHGWPATGQEFAELAERFELPGPAASAELKSRLWPESFRR